MDDSEYFWTPIRSQKIAARRSSSAATTVALAVAPPIKNELVESMRYITYSTSTAPTDPGVKASIKCANTGPIDPLSGRGPKQGDLFLVELFFSPLTTPYGEYIVIQNRSNTLVNLGGCTLSDLTNPGHRERDLAVLPPCPLAPTGRLRINTCHGLNTPLEANNLGLEPSNPLLFHLNKGTAVWNNEGDVVRLRNISNELLIQYGYADYDDQLYPLIAADLKLPPIYKPPRPEDCAVIHTFSSWIEGTRSVKDPNPALLAVSDFEVMPGDMLKIETDEEALRQKIASSPGTFHQGLIRRDNDVTNSTWHLPSGDVVLKEGRIITGQNANKAFPCNNGQQISLIMGLTIGASGSPPTILSVGERNGVKLVPLDVHVPKDKLSVAFGINDYALGDNTGWFKVTLSILRPKA